MPHRRLVDPATSALEPSRPVDASEPVGTFGPGDVFRPEPFPEPEIPIDDLRA